MAAALNLVFNVDNNASGTKTIIIHDPKDNLSKATVQAAVDKIIATKMFKLKMIIMIRKIRQNQVKMG